ncbi:KAP family P-loop NTPase fold protein [Acinetobacter tibetensis]|uniref:KAP family NTPase n=1 Tax=Acinetobacter tibetensis TaxID=2943497 RepID=A0AAE9LT47_9GAMM|nr:P-loop NTPase fold protein [Acinetobacter tibetensis]USE84010.1 KAP family NTPase [Acinetobacter tibetensis]
MTDQTQLNWNRTNLDNIETAWEGDLWDRKRLGIQLTSYVDRLQCGAVLTLDARWGEGKTWFVRNWQKHLEDENHHVIYLDAFANDYLDDPFLTIAAEISQTFKNSDNIDDADVNSFNEKTASVLISLAAILPVIAAKAGLHWIGLGGAGEAIQEVYKDGKDIYDSVSDEITGKLKEHIEKKIENHHLEKELIQDFKRELNQLADKLEKPLVFIIDELDRCRPDFAIRLIEKIKHFFDIPKIVFVLVMDKTQFSKVVCHNYGYDEESGEEYLDKFVDFTIRLKSTLNEPDFYAEVIKHLFVNVLGYKYELLESNNFYHECRAYNQATGYSKREIINLIHRFSLLVTGDDKKDSLVLAALFFKNSEDLFKDIFLAIHNYTDFIIRKNNSAFGDVWYETDREQRSNIMLNVWSNSFGVTSSIVNFINLVKQNIGDRESFISSSIFTQKIDQKILSLLQSYSINSLCQSNQFDLKWFQYIESGIKH